MSSQYKTLVFFLIGIPKLSGLSIERTRTRDTWLAVAQLVSEKKKTYLFGSPNKLCKLSNTLWTLYTALHFSLRISRQMRPEKSTFG